MPNLRLPLSGDVSQTINPWTWFMKTVGGQFGLININLGKSSDPELEQRISTTWEPMGGSWDRWGMRSPSC